MGSWVLLGTGQVLDTGFMKMGIQPDGKTFIALLCGCIYAGLVDEGHKYFNSMGRVYSLTPTIEHYGN